jgi:hypothetical protein
VSKRILEFPPLEVGEVELSQEERFELQQQLSNGMSALGSLKYVIDKGHKLERSVVKSTLSLTEAAVAKASGLTGMNLDSEEAVERRHRQIRELNLRIRELEAEVGRGASSEMLTQGVKVLGKKLKGWWETEGLGFIPMGELSISEYGIISTTLSCDISIHRAKRYKRDADWFEWLKSQGFELTSESHAGQDHSILDCDSSRKALRALILKTFPTARIVRTANHAVYGTEDMGLKDVEVLIYELHEAWVLPDPVEEVD